MSCEHNARCLHQRTRARRPDAKKHPADSSAGDDRIPPSPAHATLHRSEQCHPATGLSAVTTACPRSRSQYGRLAHAGLGSGSRLWPRCHWASPHRRATRAGSERPRLRQAGRIVRWAQLEGIDTTTRSHRPPRPLMTMKDRRGPDCRIIAMRKRARWRGCRPPSSTAALPVAEQSGRAGVATASGVNQPRSARRTTTSPGRALVLGRASHHPRRATWIARHPRLAPLAWALPDTDRLRRPRCRRGRGTGSAVRRDLPRRAHRLPESAEKPRVARGGRRIDAGASGCDPVPDSFRTGLARRCLSRQPRKPIAVQANTGSVRLGPGFP